MNNKSEHGKIFKKLRLERGLKLKEAAGNIVSVQTLRRFEAGETSVSLVTFEKLMANIGIGYVEFLTELLPKLDEEVSEFSEVALNFAKSGNFSGYDFSFC